MLWGDIQKKHWPKIMGYHYHRPHILMQNQMGSFIYYVRKIFRKTNTSYPLNMHTYACVSVVICTRTSEYQWVKYVSFSENFSNVINEWSPCAFIYPLLLRLIVKMQNICNLIGQTSMHISDIFDCYTAYVKCISEI